MTRPSPQPARPGVVEYRLTVSADKTTGQILEINLDRTDLGKNFTYPVRLAEVLKTFGTKELPNFNAAMDKLNETITRMETGIWNREPVKTDGV